MAGQVWLTHLLADMTPLDDLRLPMKGSSRLRYTCCSVSAHFIALGSNTGCVYVFARDSLKHIKSIYGDVDSSPVTCVALAPSETIVAFAVSSGQVAVLEMNIERRSKPERVRQTTDHLGARVTAMVWDASGSSLFVGDSTGKVTLVNIPTSKAKSLFLHPSQTIVRLDCGLVQLDWWGGKLLASTLRASYLLNTEKQQFSQIGKKPRDGEFGACFFLEPSVQYPVIYCARPGSRMWEVDFEGNVLNTHQFKQLLATPPLPIVTPKLDLPEDGEVVSAGPQSVNFQHMLCIGEFILTWSSKGLYVFDPINVKVVLWTEDVKGVVCISVHRTEVYLLLDSQEVRRLVFLPVLQLFKALLSPPRCSTAARLLLFLLRLPAQPALLKRLRKLLLPQLLSMLSGQGQLRLAEKLQASLEDVSESSLDSLSVAGSEEGEGEGGLDQLYPTEASGIVVISDGSLSASRRCSPSHVCSQLKDAGVPPHPDDATGTGDHAISSVKDQVTSLTPGRLTSIESETSTLDGEEIYSNDLPLSQNRELSSEESKLCPALLQDRAEADNNDVEVCVKEDMSESPCGAVEREGNDETVTSDARKTERCSLASLDKEEECLSDPDCAEHQYQGGWKRQGEGGMRKTNSMPDIASKPNLQEHSSEERSVQSPRIPTSPHSAEWNSDIVMKTKKKKKQRRANQVDFIHSSSGHLTRSLSTGTLKQKKLELQPQRSLDSSPARGAEDQLYRYQSLETDPDSVSISTISSIEEEEEAEPERSPVHTHSTGVAADETTLNPSFTDESINLGPVAAEMATVPIDESTNPVFLVNDESTNPVFLVTDKSTDSIFLATGESADPVFLATLESELSSISQISKALGMNTGEESQVSTVRNILISSHSDVQSEEEVFIPSQAEDEDGAELKDDSVQKCVEGETEIDLEDSTELDRNEFRRQSYHSHYHEQNPDRRGEDEVIPTLIQRLSASGVASAQAWAEEGGGGSQNFSLVKGVIASTSKQKIASVKQRVTKISSTTRSLLRLVKEKNRLLLKSPSQSPPSSFGAVLSTSPPASDEQEMGNILFNDLDPATSDTTLSSCGIDLEPFLKQTRATEEQLKDPALLLNSKRLKPVLNTWATLLNQTLMAYHVELQRRHEEEVKKDQEKQREQNHEGENVDSQLQETVESCNSPRDKGKQNGTSIISSHLKENSVQKNNTAASMSSSPMMMNHDALLKSGSESGDSFESQIYIESSSELDTRSSKGKTKTKNVDVNGNQRKEENNSIDCDGADDDKEHSQSYSSQLDSSLNSIYTLSESERQINPDKSSNSKPFSSQFEENREPIVRSKMSMSDNDSEVKRQMFKHDKDSGFDLRVACHVKDPFQLSPQQHMAVSRLVTHCLECGCFGNVSSILSSLDPPPKGVCGNRNSHEAVSSSVKSFADAESSLSSQTEPKIPDVPADSDNLTSRLSPSGLVSKDSGKENHHFVFTQTSTNSETAVPDDNSHLKQLKSQEFRTSLSTFPNQDVWLRSNSRNPSQNSSAPHQCHTLDDAELVDKERALFVHFHFHFIPFWRLRQLLAKCDAREAFSTWCAMISCSQVVGRGDIVWMKTEDGDVTGALDYLHSGILPNKHALLGHLARLFGVSWGRVVSFVSGSGRHVGVQDLLYLCRLHRRPARQVLAPYLTQRLSPAPPHARSEILQRLCASSESRLAVLECLLHLQSQSILPSSSSSFSSLAASSSLSAEASQLSPACVRELLHHVLAQLEGADVSPALEACSQYRYWPGYLALLKRGDQWQAALQLEVQLDDITLLNGHTSYGFTPRDKEEWLYLLRLYQQTSSDVKLSFKQFSPDLSQPGSSASSVVNSSASDAVLGKGDTNIKEHETLKKMVARFPSDQSGLNEVSLWLTHEETGHGKGDNVSAVSGKVKGRESLSWPGLGALMTRHLGASIAVQTLCDVALGGETFSADYRTCLALAALERQQKLVVHNMLEKVDSYLWAKKPVQLAPQVYYAASEEKSAVENMREDHHHHALFSRLSSHPVPGKQLAEDPDCHWGITSSILRKCQVCLVAVTDTVSHMEPGLVAFKCGHVFHKFCAPEINCPLC